jgi:DNA polymerase-3 subunit epsilon
MRAGDTVKHLPSGETWVLAYADGPHVSACGWPESIAQASDCELVEAATDEQHVTMLRKWAEPPKRRDSGAIDGRSLVCARQLALLAPTRLLILDVETGGLDPATDPVVEIAAALFDVGTRSVLWSYGSLLPGDANDCSVINGISPFMLEHVRAIAEANPGEEGFEPGWDPVDPIRRIIEVATAQPYARLVAAAHHAEFDRPFVERLFSGPLHRVGGGALPWICTERDIEWRAASAKSRVLAHLCADYGVPVMRRHRAAGDVAMLCALLAELADLDVQVARALKPRGIFRGLQRFEDNDLAKAAGFRWDADGKDCGRPKTWWRVYPADEPTDPTADRPFAIELIRPV